jgi:hypothetical protein
MQLNYRNPLISLTIAGFFLACSADNGAEPATVASGGTPGAAGTAGTTTIGNAGAQTGSSGASSGGAAGSTGGSTTLPEAGTNAGGAGAGGDTSTGGGGAAQGGSGGESTAGAAGAGGAASTAPEGPFTCTEFIGAYMSMEWWNKGFEDKLMAAGGDPNKWQLKWHHHGYVNTWGDVNSVFWENEGDPMDDSKGAPIQSACTTGSDAPDRIIFFAIDWEMLTEEDWLAALNNAIATIQIKRPNAKRIDVMPLVRCKDNMMCNDNAMYGPGANDSAGPQDCYVPPYVDSAMLLSVAANSSIAAMGLVTEGTTCSGDGAHLTGDDNEVLAQQLADFYAARL